MAPQDFDFARRSALLAGLPDHVCDGLLSQAHVRRFDRGVSVFMQGDAARHLQIVVDGWVKLYRVTQAGDEALIDLVGTGQSIADVRALNTAPYSVSCETCSDCCIVLLDPRAVFACAEARAALTDAVLRHSGTQMDRMFHQLEQLKVMSASQRLASFLLDAGRVRGVPAEFTLPYDKHLLAAHLGMKPESLSRAFGRLRAVGVAVRQKRVRIAHPAALRAHCQEETRLAAVA